MRISKKLLFELQPDEFEKLCLRLLETLGFKMITKMKPSIGVGFDFQGQLYENDKVKNAAIIIKHKLELSKEDILKISSDFFRIGTFNDIFVLITSSKITDSIQEIADNYLKKKGEIRIIDQDEMLSLINDSLEIVDDFFSSIKKKLYRKKIELSLSIVGTIIGIIGVIISSLQKFVLVREPLDVRINKVESAINSIKDLESYLKDIKTEMIEKEKSTKLINEEYKKAKVLEALTKEQLETIRLALKTQNLKDIIFNLFMGFILGIGSSFLASILNEKRKHYRALK